MFLSPLFAVSAASKEGKPMFHLTSSSQERLALPSYRTPHLLPVASAWLYYVLLLCFHLLNTF